MKNPLKHFFKYEATSRETIYAIHSALLAGEGITFSFDDDGLGLGASYAPDDKAARDLVHDIARRYRLELVDDGYYYVIVSAAEIDEIRAMFAAFEEYPEIRRGMVTKERAFVVNAAGVVHYYSSLLGFDRSYKQIVRAIVAQHNGELGVPTYHSRETRRR